MKIFLIGILSIFITSGFAATTCPQSPPQKIVCGNDTLFVYPTDIPKGHIDNSTCNDDGTLTVMQYGCPSGFDCGDTINLSSSVIHFAGEKDIPYLPHCSCSAGKCQVKKE